MNYFFKCIAAIIAATPVCAMAQYGRESYGPAITDTELNRMLVNFTGETKKGTAQEVADLMNLYDHQRIRFQPLNSSNYDCIRLAEPDTLWLKPRPKKNAKEGKHYMLTNVYKGAVQPGGSKKHPRILTPKDSLQQSTFILVKAEPLGEDSVRMSMTDWDLKDVTVDLSIRHPQIKGFRQVDAEGYYVAYAIPIHMIGNSAAAGPQDKVMQMDSIANSFRFLTAHRGAAESKSKIYLHDDAGENVCIDRPQYTLVDFSHRPEGLAQFQEPQWRLCNPGEYEIWFKPIRTSLLELVQSLPRANTASHAMTSPFTTSIKGGAKCGIWLRREINPANRVNTYLEAPMTLPADDEITVTGSLTGDYVVGVMYGVPVFVKSSDLVLTPEQQAALEVMEGVHMREIVQATAASMDGNAIYDKLCQWPAQKDMPLLVAPILTPDPAVNALARRDNEPFNSAGYQMCIYSIHNDDKLIEDVDYSLSAYDGSGMIRNPFTSKSEVVITSHNKYGVNEKLQWLYFINPWKMGNRTPERIELNYVKVHYADGTTKKYTNIAEMMLAKEAGEKMANVVTVFQLWDKLRDHLHNQR